LSGTHLERRGGWPAIDNKQGGPAFVIGHGFTHSTHEPVTGAVLTAFSAQGGVLAADFRGHGRSGGRSSVGRDEVLDLDAVVSRARDLGYGPVCVVGFSMGAAVALRQAAVGRSPGDAVVSVSSPSRWYVRESKPMLRLQWLLENPARRPIGRALGVRLGEPWFDLPISPIEAVGKITRPLLLVQGTADRYFTPAQARLLWAAAGGSAELWIESGMGHGETATTPALVERIAGWALDLRVMQA
jgi:pimeloyl-ACP methyl ester carboxylesterase